VFLAQQKVHAIPVYADVERVESRMFGAFGALHLRLRYQAWKHKNGEREEGGGKGEERASVHAVKI
jgi:hypothetical protein